MLRGVVFEPSLVSDTMESHIPPLPSTSSIELHTDAWEAYAKGILTLIARKRYNDKDRALDIELRKYEHEALEERMDRSRNSDEWAFEKRSAEDYRYVAIEDITCVNTEVCWYIGNCDRLNEYEGNYRLLGTRDVYLCDVCHRNMDDSLDNFLVREAIKESVADE